MISLSGLDLESMNRRYQQINTPLRDSLKTFFQQNSQAIQLGAANPNAPLYVQHLKTAMQNNAGPLNKNFDAQQKLAKTDADFSYLRDIIRLIHQMNAFLRSNAQSRQNLRNILETYRILLCGKATTSNSNWDILMHAVISRVDLQKLDHQASQFKPETISALQDWYSHFYMFVMVPDYVIVEKVIERVEDTIRHNEPIVPMSTKKIDSLELNDDERNYVEEFRQFINVFELYLKNKSYEAITLIAIREVISHFCASNVYQHSV